MKKVLVSILAFLLVISVNPVSAKTDLISKGYTITDNSVTTTATEEQAKSYEVYDLKIFLGNDAETILEFVQNHYQLSYETKVGEDIVSVYNCEDITDFLPLCEQLIEVMIFHNHLYVQYNSIDEKEIYLSYDGNTILSKTVYDESNDLAFIQDKGTSYFVDHFREGVHYQMDDETMEEIQMLASKNDYKSIEEKYDMTISHIDGNIIIEPNNFLYTPSTNNTQLLNDLTTKFPQYTNSIKLSTSKYCSALSRNVPVKVTETRNSYTRKSANWRTFVATTAITAIASFLTVTTSAVATILTTLGIGISAAEAITSSVDLCNSAIYTYHGTRRGCVYDYTVHNSYVLVIRYESSAGKFTGGYLNTGEFNWVDNRACTAYNYAYSSIATTAINNYNNNLFSNYYLTTYLKEYDTWSD